MNIIKRKLVKPLQKAGNRLLRKPVNRASLNAFRAMKNATESISFDKTGMTRANTNSLRKIFEARNKLTLTRVENSKGPQGFVRARINPGAMARLKRLKELKAKRT